MKKTRIVTKTTKISDLTFDDIYDEISQDWQYRAKQLQIRRWRMLKRAMKGGHYAAR